MKFQLVAAALITLAVSGQARAATYDIDTGHSHVGFKIKHLVISNVSGKFNKFTGKIDYDKAKPKEAKVEAVIDVASIDTNEPKRDKHLRSGDFFDTAKFPSLTFKSTKVKDVDGNEIELEGELTMHGVTKPVVLKVQMTGEAKDPWGNEKIGFTAETKVERKDFGLTWNKALETGGVVVGDEVKISLDIEANKAKEVVVGGGAGDAKKKAKR